MKKGVVMEKNKRYMIVMTGKGEFVRARLNRKAEVGEEVAYMPASFFQYSVYRNKAYSLPLSAALVLLLIYPALTFFSPEKVHGVVALDMNPSIEFSVDEEYEVISVYGYNDKGRELLAELEGELDGKPLYSAVEAAIEQGLGADITAEPRDIYISSPLNLFDDLTWGESYDDWIESMQDEFTINFITLSLEEQIMREAREASLSPVKYLLFSDARSQGLSMDINKANNETINNLEGDTGKEVTTLISPENVKVSPTRNVQSQETADTINLEKLISETKTISFKVPEQNEADEEDEEEDNNEAELQKKENNSTSGGRSGEHPSENRNSSAEKNKNNKPDDHPSQLKEKNSSQGNPQKSGSIPENKDNRKNNQGNGNAISDKKSNGNSDNKGNNGNNGNNGTDGNKGNSGKNNGNPVQGENKGKHGGGQGQGSAPGSGAGGNPGGPGGNPGKGNN